MSKLVKFDDGFGNFEFQGIFPTSAPKKEIIETVKKAIKRECNRRGTTIDDYHFTYEDVDEMTDIYSMKDGKMYITDNFGHMYQTK